MIDADAGEHRAIRVHYVHRVEPAAETHFQHRRFDSLAREEPQRRERAVLEIGERDFAARGLHRFERRAERVVARLRARDAHALVVAFEMRRRIEPGLVAARAQHRFQHGAARALAIGARDGDDRAAKLDTHALVDPRHALQAERDALRMLALDERQPLAERPHARLSS